MPARRALLLCLLALPACSTEPLPLSAPASSSVAPALRRAGAVLGPTECVRRFEVAEATRTGRLPSAGLRLDGCATRG